MEGQPAQPQQPTAEELAQMSPEQIKELQMKNCIFCHIVKGNVQSKKMFEDDRLIGVLDINPANPGHLLLISKEHYMVLPQMPDPDINHLFMVAKGISHAMLKGLKAQGTNIFIANGAQAGQKAPHFMMHIIPRKDGDGLQCFNLNRKSAKDLLKMKETIQPKLYALLGKTPPQDSVESIPHEKPIEDLDIPEPPKPFRKEGFPPLEPPPDPIPPPPAEIEGIDPPPLQAAMEPPPDLPDVPDFDEIAAHLEQENPLRRQMKDSLTGKKDKSGKASIPVLEEELELPPPPEPETEDAEPEELPEHLSAPEHEQFVPQKAAPKMAVPKKKAVKTKKKPKIPPKKKAVPKKDESANLDDIAQVLFG
ncbi:MAG: HIT domain-containing protein [Nanoarchaeota archaeon]